MKNELFGINFRISVHGIVFKARGGGGRGGEGEGYRFRLWGIHITYCTNWLQGVERVFSIFFYFVCFVLFFSFSFFILSFLGSCHALRGSPMADLTPRYRTHKDPCLCVSEPMDALTDTTNPEGAIITYTYIYKQFLFNAIKCMICAEEKNDN